MIISGPTLTKKGSVIIFLMIFGIQKMSLFGKKIE
jgi:hypothetical protein